MAKDAFYFLKLILSQVAFTISAGLFLAMAGKLIMHGHLMSANGVPMSLADTFNLAMITLAVLRWSGHHFFKD